MTNNIKAGVRTTEFYVTLASLLAGVAAMLGWLSPEQADAVPKAVGQVAGGVIAGAAALGYTVSRGMAKRGAGAAEPGGES